MDEDHSIIDNKIKNDLLDIIEKTPNVCSIHPHLECDQCCSACSVYNICAICYAENHMGHERMDHREGADAFTHDWRSYFPALIQYVKEYEVPPSVSIKAREPGTDRIIHLGQWFSGILQSWKEGKLSDTHKMKIEHILGNDLLQITHEGKNMDSKMTSCSSNDTSSSIRKRKRNSSLVDIEVNTEVEILDGANVLFHYISSDNQIICSIGTVLNEVSDPVSSSSQDISLHGNSSNDDSRRYRLHRYESNIEEDNVCFISPECRDESYISFVKECQIHLIGITFEAASMDNSGKYQLTSESKEALTSFKERLPIDWEDGIPMSDGLAPSLNKYLVYVLQK